jgi:hypothetical protein
MARQLSQTPSFESGLLSKKNKRLCRRQTLSVSKTSPFLHAFDILPISWRALLPPVAAWIFSEFRTKRARKKLHTKTVVLFGFSEYNNRAPLCILNRSRTVRTFCEENFNRQRFPIDVPTGPRMHSAKGPPPWPRAPRYPEDQIIRAVG